MKTNEPTPEKKPLTPAEKAWLLGVADVANAIITTATTRPEGQEEVTREEQHQIIAGVILGLKSMLETTYLDDTMPILPPLHPITLLLLCLDDSLNCLKAVAYAQIQTAQPAPVEL